MDVAKASLETSDAEGRTRRTFSNGVTGVDQMVRWLGRDFESGDVRAVLEPTSTYHQVLVQRLKEAGVQFVMVSPFRAHRYAASVGMRAKTDRVDAQMLARMGEREGLQPSEPPDEGQERLKALRRHSEWLGDQVRSVRNRLEAAERSPWTPPDVLRSLRKIIRDLEAQGAAAEKEIERTVQGDRHYSSLVSILTTVPGVGLKTAVLILSELPKPERCKSSRSWPAFCGVAPQTHQSGPTSYGVLSRMGSSRLRAHLYMAAVAAMRYNPAVKAYVERLAARGKTGKRAVMAAMHKLLRICFGVLKNRTPFDPKIHLGYA